jgi:hypothetical protein
MTAPFPAERLAPFLRGMLDPEGKGDLTAEQEAVIDKVEENVARHSTSDDDS